MGRAEADAADLRAAHARAIGPMAETGDVARAAEAAGVDAETVRGWLDGDAEFLAGLNRARSERADRLRSEFRSLASEALAALRELVTGPDVPAAVRLRASLAVLGAVDATRVEMIGPTSAAEIRAELTRRELYASLGV